MSRLIRIAVPIPGRLSLAGSLSALLFVVGCSEVKPPADPPQADSTETSEADEVAAMMAKLPEEDRALAVAQVNCIVSDEPLGSMGVPVRIDVKGRAMFVCCEGCSGPLKDDPDKYIAKLDAATGGSSEAGAEPEPPAGDATEGTETEGAAEPTES